MKMIIEMLNQIGGIGVIFTVIGACIKYNSNYYFYMHKIY